MERTGEFFEKAWRGLTGNFGRGEQRENGNPAVHPLPQELAGPEKIVRMLNPRPPEERQEAIMPPAGESIGAANPPTKRGQKILIIKSDKQTAKIYKKHFEEAGFEARVEVDGSEGYYRICEMHPDAVLMDIQLPGMDGLSIIRKFRAQKKFTTLPIIALSATPYGVTKKDLINDGATRILNMVTTPPKEIVATVLNLLDQIIAVPDVEPAHSIATSFQSSELLNDSPFHLENIAESPTTPPCFPAEEPPLSDAPQKDELDEKIALQSAVREEFLQKCIDHICGLRTMFRSLTSNTKSPPNAETFLEMEQILRTISGHATIVGLPYLAHFAAVFESLMRDLYICPSHFGASTKVAIARAIDLAARLIHCGSSCGLREFSCLNVLVVERDKMDRALITNTLNWTKCSHVGTGLSQTALELLQENEFDLVILDVNGDEMSGFELCKASRQMNRYQNTPVIFVSSLSDFHTKMVSLQSGGNDCIIKPFVPMELALKALLFMICSQLGPASTPTERHGQD